MQYLGHTSGKKFFVVDLKFKVHWAFYVVSGNPDSATSCWTLWDCEVVWNLSWDWAIVIPRRPLVRVVSPRSPSVLLPWGWVGPHYTLGCQVRGLRRGAVKLVLYEAEQRQQCSDTRQWTVCQRHPQMVKGSDGENKSQSLCSNLSSAPHEGRLSVVSMSYFPRF